MKIQYLSDLHLEFSENREYIRNNPIIPSADILIIAGDLGYLNLFRKHHIYKEYCDSFLASVSSRLNENEPIKNADYVMISNKSSKIY